MQNSLNVFLKNWHKTEYGSKTCTTYGSRLRMTKSTNLMMSVVVCGG